MIIRLCVIACLASGSALLGSYRSAAADDSHADSFSISQSNGSHSSPEAVNDNVAQAQEDDSGSTADAPASDSSSGDSSAPTNPDN
jgi:hypothetical protein